ncbi:sensor domain-containing diguanylate cyclase [Desulfoferula mesophila]|uniref:diguanylate cyclase n=1 Tax=Desulfoferula mesophila TaxID=3058419 RepID=A0AAU9E814_9BACT|nr:hypothetical protein FAK_01310 [Desulfoferula mesophilus]
MNGQSFTDELVRLCPDGIIGVNREGTVVIFNEAAERMFQRDKQDVLDKLHITEIYYPPDLARQIKKLLYDQEHGGRGRVDEVEVEAINAEGRKMPIRLSAALLTEGGREVGSVGFFHDMSTRKALEQELLLRSITDSLTGLANRRHFQEVLHVEARRAQRYRRPLSLAILDMDGFKRINDTYGHQQGDELLKLLGQSLRQNLRQVDRAFRLGGDEFALLLAETTREQGMVAVDRFRQHFKQVCHPAMDHLEGTPIPVTLSLGLAQLEAGEAPEKLIKRADMAMYEAKKQGGDRVIQAPPTAEED